MANNQKSPNIHDNTEIIADRNHPQDVMYGLSNLTHILKLILIEIDDHKQMERESRFYRNSNISLKNRERISRRIGVTSKDIGNFLAIFNNYSVTEVSNRLNFDYIEGTATTATTVLEALRQESIDSEDKASELFSTLGAFVRRLRQIVRTNLDGYDAITDDPDYQDMPSIQIGKLSQRINSLTADMRKLSDVQAVVEKMRSSQTECENILAAVKTESTQIIESARNAAETAGLTAFEIHFQKQETSCKSRRWWWLGGIMTFLIISTGCALYFYFHPVRDDDKNVIYQILVARVALLGLLISAALWCGRIYKALYHQEITNNHRSLCLKTMGAFINSVTNTEAHDAVIVQCTKAIFGSVPSGFINDSGGEPDVNLIAVANRMVHPEK